MHFTFFDFHEQGLAPVWRRVDTNSPDSLRRAFSEGVLAEVFPRGIPSVQEEEETADDSIYVDPVASEIPRLMDLQHREDGIHRMAISSVTEVGGGTILTICEFR